MMIREATAADAPAIAALHAASWQVAYRGIMSDAYLDGEVFDERRAVWAERFAEASPNQAIVVAEDAGDLVGFICLYGCDDARWGTLFDNVHVSPRHHRRGIGVALMEAAARLCAERFPDAGIYLWVVDANRGAQAFYARIGGANVETSTWSPPDGSHAGKYRIAWATPQALAIATAREAARTASAAGPRVQPIRPDRARMIR